MGIQQELPRQNLEPQMGPQNQNQVLEIPQEPLGQHPEHQKRPLEVIAPTAQDGVAQHYGLPRHGAPMEQPGLRVRRQGQQPRPQEPQRRPDIQQELPTQDPEPQLGPQNPDPELQQKAQVQEPVAQRLRRPRGARQASQRHNPIGVQSGPMRLRSAQRNRRN
uniref:Extensin-like n=1 Tax=Caenorhabditis tropicalis TaxID=1561998 RepID=A0A1I7T369_9PELO